MPTIKCTSLFTLSTTGSGTTSGVRVGGWSESWYFDGTFAAARTSFERLCQYRANLMPTSALIIGQRYQQVNPTVGSSQVQNRIFPGLAGTQNDIPQMALLVKVPSLGTPNIRQWALRGIPDARVVGGEYNPSAAFTADFNSFAVILAEFRFRGRDQSAEQANINYIADDGSVFLLSPMTLVVNDLVTVSRAMTEEHNFVGGQFTVETVTSSVAVKLRNWTNGEVTGGKLRKLSYIFPLVDFPGVRLGRVITKKVGRPFNSYRGRRSKRR